MLLGVPFKCVIFGELFRYARLIARLIQGIQSSTAARDRL